MIINKSKRFIFVHNPKTAGSSIHKALAAYNEVKRPAKTKHETISELQNRTSLRLDEYFVFGFARNPWDRFSSFYHFSTLLFQ